MPGLPSFEVPRRLIPTVYRPPKAWLSLDSTLLAQSLRHAPTHLSVREKASTDRSVPDYCP
jgi:hypothetical protein